MHPISDDHVTLDDLRAVHPGTPGAGDGNVWIAALEDGWLPSEIIRSAELYARLIARQGGSPLSVEAWLRRSLGGPPARSRL